MILLLLIYIINNIIFNIIFISFIIINIHLYNS